MKSNIQNTSEEIKKKHKKVLTQLEKFNEILKEIKLANNNTQAIITAGEILKIINISDEDFLKKHHKTKKEILNRLNELGQYSPIAKEKYKHFTHIWSCNMTQILKNYSPKKDQKNETPKEVKLTNHNTQAAIAAHNISDKASLAISHGNIYTLILSGENESRNFTPIVKKDERDNTTKLKVLVQNQETSNKLRKLFERGIPGYKLNFVIHRSIITLNQYDYSYNNSLKDIESYSKYTLINTDIQKDKTTKLSITEHNNSLNNQLTTPLENRSDKKSSSVTYTHTQKDSKITKSIASGIGFVTGSFLGIAIVMLVTELPFFAFTFASALVGATIGYGVATLYEKVNEKRGESTEVNTCTILKDVSTLECFKGNSNKFEAHVS